MVEQIKNGPVEHELADLIHSKVAVQLIEFFSDRPGEELYQNELLDELRSKYNPKLTNPTVKKWLDIFVENDVLARRKKNKWVLYSLNRTNPVVKQLRIFLNVTRLYAILRKLYIGDAELYLFGSAARGENSENSDIDLLVIGTIDDAIRSEIRRNVVVRMKNEVSFVVYSRLQYSDLARKDKAFYDSIERDKINLLRG